MDGDMRLIRGHGYQKSWEKVLSISGQMSCPANVTNHYTMHYL